MNRLVHVPAALRAALRAATQLLGWTHFNPRLTGLFPFHDMLRELYGNKFRDGVRLSIQNKLGIALLVNGNRGAGAMRYELVLS